MGFNPKEKHLNNPEFGTAVQPYTPVMNQTAFEAKLIRMEKEERVRADIAYKMGLQGRDGGACVHFHD